MAKRSDFNKIFRFGLRFGRLLVVSLIVILVIIEILVLRPAKLDPHETESKQGMFNSLRAFIQKRRDNDEIRYSIDQFHYMSTEKGLKQWEIFSDSAVLYNNSQKVVTAETKIIMYDSHGNVTEITGDEAQYVMGSRDFSIYRNVVVNFPDGFQLQTEEAYYNSKQGLVYSHHPFFGHSTETSEDNIKIWGVGFSAPRLGPEVFVQAKSKVEITQKSNGEKSIINSDYSQFNRMKKVAYFTMEKDTAFVESYLGTLFVKSRRQEVQFGEGGQKLKYMIANDDVYLKENQPKDTKKGIQYGTSQRAEFFALDNRIVMSGYPSVYQNNDTVTGTIITVYRSKNQVEVTDSVGYHDGGASE